LRRDKEIIKEAKKEIEHFKDEVDKDDTMNLYYFDESSFSLSPNIPYGWSPKNETIILEATRSKSLKVLGFLGLDNQLKAYTTTGKYLPIKPKVITHRLKRWLDGCEQSQRLPLSSVSS